MPRPARSPTLKGCTYDSAVERWRVRVTYKGKQLHMGRYTDSTEAGHAYDRAAVYLLGPDDAHLNFGAAAALSDATPPTPGLIALLRKHRRHLVVPLPPELAVHIDHGMPLPAVSAGSKRSRGNRASSSGCGAAGAGAQPCLGAEAAASDGMLRLSSHASISSQLPSRAPASLLQQQQHSGAGGSPLRYGVADGFVDQAWQLGNASATLTVACPDAVGLPAQQTDQQLADLACMAAVRMTLDAEDGLAAPGPAGPLAMYRPAAATDLQAGGSCMACDHVNDDGFWAAFNAPSAETDEQAGQGLFDLLMEEPGHDSHLLWQPTLVGDMVCADVADAGMAAVAEAGQPAPPGCPLMTQAQLPAEHPMEPIVALPAGGPACPLAGDPIAQTLQGYSSQQQPEGCAGGLGGADMHMHPGMDLTADTGMEGGLEGAAEDEQAPDWAGLQQIGTLASMVRAAARPAGSFAVPAPTVPTSGDADMLLDLLQSILVQRLPMALVAPDWAQGTLTDALIPACVTANGQPARIRMQLTIRRNPDEPQQQQQQQQQQQPSCA